ncbi:MAG: hypothetical protein OXQ90_06055 [Gammaproteobacteria bacterium]|nr:hypothetical protein [Gammaproteobacteria bacterium]
MRKIGLPIIASLVVFGCESSPNGANCHEVLERMDISLVLDKRKEVRTRGFFESLAADGYSARERELIADIAGVANPDLDDTRPLPFVVSELPPPPHADTTFPSERLLEIRRLVVGGRLDELAALVADDPSLARTALLGNSLAGMVILQPPGVLAASMNRLVDAGFEFGLHELASAIGNEVPLATFELLLDHGEADLAEAWTDQSNNRPMDLAGFAAAKHRFDLLDALLQRNPRPGGSRAMDYLPEPSNDEDVAATEDIVQRLAAAGYVPMLPSTVTRLRAWMPEPSLAALDYARVPGLTQPVQAVAEEFRDEIRRLDEGLATAREQESRCLDDGAGQSGKSRSLLAKRKVSEPPLRTGPDASDMATFFRKWESPDVEASAESLLDRQIEFLYPAIDGRWEDFLGAVEDLPEDADPTALSMATRVSLLLAPHDVVVKTLARIDELPENAAILAASRTAGDDVKIFEELRGRGMDLHVVDDTGHNAISTAVRVMQSRETLDYLLANGVAVKLDSPGYDPLDRVLRNLLNDSFRTSASVSPWVRTLIDHGAPIEASHLQLMELLRLDRSAVYSDVVKEVPELARST